MGYSFLSFQIDRSGDPRGAVANVNVGGKQSHQNMTIYPLLISDGGEPGFMILEEGLAQGIVEITEISHGGSGPELKLINRSMSNL